MQYREPVPILPTSCSMGILLIPILQYGQIGHPKPKSHPNTVFLQYRWLNRLGTVELGLVGLG